VALKYIIDDTVHIKLILISIINNGYILQEGNEKNRKLVRGIAFALLICAVVWLESLLLPNCLIPFVNYFTKHYSKEIAYQTIPSSYFYSPISFSIHLPLLIYYKIIYKNKMMGHLHILMRLHPT